MGRANVTELGLPGLGVVLLGRVWQFRLKRKVVSLKGMAVYFV